MNTSVHVTIWWKSLNESRVRTVTCTQNTQNWGKKGEYHTETSQLLLTHKYTKQSEGKMSVRKKNTARFVGNWPPLWATISRPCLMVLKTRTSGKLPDSDLGRCHYLGLCGGLHSTHLFHIVLLRPGNPLTYTHRIQ